MLACSYGSCASTQLERIALLCNVAAARYSPVSRTSRSFSSLAVLLRTRLFCRRASSTVVSSVRQEGTSLPKSMPCLHSHRRFETRRPRMCFLHLIWLSRSRFRYRMFSSRTLAALSTARVPFFQPSPCTITHAARLLRAPAMLRHDHASCDAAACG